MEIKFNIPDLSELKPFSVTFMMSHFFTGSGPKGRKAFALVMNFIRLVDLAIREYENGRDALCEFATTINGFGLHLTIRASAHFEVCISTLKRSVYLLKRIQKHPEVPQSLKDLLPRGSRVLPGQGEHQILDMRNAIQHLEERIITGEIMAGQSLGLMPSEDCIELGGCRILYPDLAEWLRELHIHAIRLSQYREDGVAVK